MSEGWIFCADTKTTLATQASAMTAMRDVCMLKGGSCKGLSECRSEKWSVSSRVGPMAGNNPQRLGKNPRKPGTLNLEP
jgi:hypothetical protein